MMKPRSISGYFLRILEILSDADSKGERREFMRALLKSVSLVVHESKNPDEALDVAIKVIKAEVDSSSDAIN